eukprot:5957569-Prymnesium_polylepis.1
MALSGVRTRRRRTLAAAARPTQPNPETVSRPASHRAPVQVGISHARSQLRAIALCEAGRQRRLALPPGAQLGQ